MRSAFLTGYGFHRSHNYFANYWRGITTKDWILKFQARFQSLNLCADSANPRDNIPNPPFFPPTRSRRSPDVPRACLWRADRAMGTRSCSSTKISIPFGKPIDVFVDMTPLSAACHHNQGHIPSDGSISQPPDRRRPPKFRFPRLHAAYKVCYI